MKKLLFIFFAIICFSGCEEIEKCGVCVTTVYVNNSVDDCFESGSVLACGKDFDSLNGRVTRVVEEDNAGYISISITRCE